MKKVKCNEKNIDRVLELIIVKDKIKFDGERFLYEVVGRNQRYIIAKTTFLPKVGDYYYTIIDTKEKIRGSLNLLFDVYDFDDRNDIKEVLDKIGDDFYKDEDGKYHISELSISQKNRVPLKMKEVRLYEE